MRTYLIATVYVIIVLGLVLGYRVIEEKEGPLKTSSVIDIFSEEQVEAEVLSYNGDFRIEFPGDPRYRHEQNRIPGTQSFVHRHIYTYEEANFRYFAIVSEYPLASQQPPNRERLENEAGKMLELAADLEYIEKSFGEWKGNTSLDFLLGGEAQRIQGRLIIIDDRLYRIFVTYSAKDQAGRGRSESFISSFRQVSLPNRD